MKNEKIFSIIVPVYNIENYIEECINSIIKQTYKNFELILVDDGSTDNSGKICDEFQQKDERIVVVHKKNGGLSDARNTGILNSTGMYLMFIDGDDFLNSNNDLKKILKMINKYNADIIQYKMVYYYDNDKYLNQKDIIDVNNVSDLFNSLNILNKNGNISVSACDKIVKRSLVIDNNLFFEVGLISEDIMWSYNLYLKSKSIKVLNHPIYVYRQQRTGSITTQKSFKHMNDMFEIIKYWFEYKYDDEKIKNLYYNMISYWYLIFRTNFSSKYYNKEMKEFIKKYDKLLFNYNDNYKVKTASKVKSIIGIKGTIILMKFYIFLKNKGICKI